MTMVIYDVPKCVLVAGSVLLDTAIARRSFCFVVCSSRHRYVEFWLTRRHRPSGAVRRALEYSGAVPGLRIINNPKCVITRACSYDSPVQRAYAECAKGYGFKIDLYSPRDRLRSASSSRRQVCDPQFLGEVAVSRSRRSQCSSDAAE